MVIIEQASKAYVISCSSSVPGGSTALQSSDATSTKSPAGSILSPLSAIVDSSDDAIVSKTLEGTIISWNRGAEQIFGYTAEEVIGKPITIIIPPDRLYEEAEVLARVRSGRKVDHYETVRRAKDGHMIDISLTVSPIRDYSGHIIGASKIARDITDRKRLEREREELLAREQAARQEAQQANCRLNEQVELLRKEVLAREQAEAELAKMIKTRDQFIATASHELRNPLNVLVLTLELLSQTSKDASGSSNIQLLVARLRTQLDRLNMLIERLFDISRIRSGKFELVKEKFDLIGLIKEVAGRFAKQTPTIRVYPGRPMMEVCWDRMRIDQAITNLVSNAVKYGEQKPISITADIQDHFVVVRVKDQGIGISPQELDRIFDPFEQGRAATSNGGLGLGLWITKAIVEAHGGSILAESELGQGSAVTMTIPLQPT
ncbi:MAG: PAS domain-containing sensor histidine kinase [Deltaproteobacteria bacterium]|nr:PAS domain-containing sensor histidine kinase [Deltaproteobacteria bacterium]